MHFLPYFNALNPDNGYQSCGNNIDDHCLTILAGALKNNNRLETLSVFENTSMTERGFGVFYKVLCNHYSVDETYDSNHSLKNILLQYWLPSRLRFCLKLNSGTDKKQVAMKNILWRHSSRFDMEPFFEWDLKCFLKLLVGVIRLEPSATFLVRGGLV